MSDYHYKAPSKEGASRHQALADAFEVLDRRIKAICPEGRERAVCITHLQTAKMWASAAVALNPDTR